MPPEEQNPTQPNEPLEPLAATPEQAAPIPVIADLEPEAQAAMGVPVTPEAAPLPVTDVQPADFGATQPQIDPTTPAVEQPAGTETEPAVSTFDVQPPVSVGNAPGGKKKRWVLPVAIVAVLVVLLGGGYVFGVYLPNRPSAVYSSSLKNTSQGLDQLISYGTSQAQKSYRSYNFDGTLKATASGSSFDATLSGALDKDSNGTLKLNADVMGQKLSANLRSVHVSGSASPDLYVQLTGIKWALDKFGLSSLDNLDGQWISIDHTSLNSGVASARQSVDTGSGSSLGTATAMPTFDQVNDAITKVQTVNKDYLFTTDSGKAVLKNDKYIGKETKDGRSTYHYQVGYDKAHLQAYVSALKTALDSSKLNDWSKQANNGKNLSQVVNIDSLTSSITTAKSDYTFDLWADTKTKLIHSLQFTDPSDSSSVFAITQNYTGGSQYPFTFSFASKAGGSTAKASLDLSVDTSTNKYTGNLTANTSGTNISFKFDLTPSNNAVQAAAPAGAKPLNDVLKQLGLGGTSLLGL